MSHAQPLYMLSRYGSYGAGSKRHGADHEPDHFAHVGKTCFSGCPYPVSVAFDGMAGA